MENSYGSENLCLFTTCSIKTQGIYGFHNTGPLTRQHLRKINKCKTNQSNLISMRLFRWLHIVVCETGKVPQNHQSYSAVHELFTQQKSKVCSFLTPCWYSMCFQRSGDTDSNGPVIKYWSKSASPGYIPYSSGHQASPWRVFFLKRLA